METTKDYKAVKDAQKSIQEKEYYKTYKEAERVINDYRTATGQDKKSAYHPASSTQVGKLRNYAGPTTKI